MQRAHLADELLHLELRARVEPRRRLVEQEQHRRGEERPRERDLLLHAAREVLHRLAAPVRGEADALEDLRDLGLACLPRRHPVEPRRVREVLLGRHLLEEARLDRDAVDEPAHGARLLERVVPEDARLAAVVQEQRRQQPDERRLARAVLAEDRDALAALDRERDVLDRDAAARADALLPADELLAQVVNFDGVHLLLQTRRRDRIEGTGAPPNGQAARGGTRVSRGATSPLDHSDWHRGLASVFFRAEMRRLFRGGTARAGHAERRTRCAERGVLPRGEREAGREAHGARRRRQDAVPLRMQRPRVHRAASADVRRVRARQVDGELVRRGRRPRRARRARRRGARRLRVIEKRGVAGRIAEEENPRT